VQRATVLRAQCDVPRATCDVLVRRAHVLVRRATCSCDEPGTSWHVAPGRRTPDVARRTGHV